MLPPALEDEERKRLLRIAREVITRGRSSSPFIARFVDRFMETNPTLRQNRAVFVSLHKGVDLRGCIGHTVPRRPLYLAVAEEAARAAFSDPRFEPVRREEVAEIQIEISVLSPLQAIAIEEIRVGTHGLLATRGLLRGLLLPQVAVERDWDAYRFAQETCRKAGMEMDAWKNGAVLEAFSAEVFGE